MTKVPPKSDLIWESGALHVLRLPAGRPGSTRGRGSRGTAWEPLRPAGRGTSCRARCGTRCRGRSRTGSCTTALTAVHNMTYCQPGQHQPVFFYPHVCTGLAGLATVHYPGPANPCPAGRLACIPPTTLHCLAPGQDLLSPHAGVLSCVVASAETPPN